MGNSQGSGTQDNWMDTKYKIEYLSWTYYDHLVQLSDHYRADQKLTHITKGITQMALRH